MDYLSCPIRTLLRFALLVLLPATLPVGLSAGRLVEVANMDELREAVYDARPGDTIELAPGTYGGKLLRVDLTGAKENPVIIRSRETGKAIMEAPLWLRGDYLQAIGLTFAGNSSFRATGTGIKLSRCTFDNVQSPQWVDVNGGSRELEISYNAFINKLNNRENDWGPVIHLQVLNDNERHHVHHNLFKNIPKGLADNRYETIQFITGGNPFVPPGGDSNSLIEDNLFIACNGEPEIISLKSNGNMIRRNTFIECQGGLVLRHGGGNEAYGNYFLGNNVPKTGGIRFQGVGQKIVSNYFQGLTDYGVMIMTGTPGNLYLPVDGALIAMNTFVDCELSFGISDLHPSAEVGLNPRWVKVIGNVFAHFEDPIEETAFIQFGRQVSGVTRESEPNPDTPPPSEPVDWLWESNYMQGGRLGADVPVAEVEDPILKRSDSGIAVPLESAPRIEFRLNSLLLLEDLSGTVRSQMTTVGAIDYRNASSARLKPLTEMDVGPDAGSRN